MLDWAIDSRSFQVLHSASSNPHLHARAKLLFPAASLSRRCLQHRYRWGLRGSHCKAERCRHLAAASSAHSKIAPSSCRQKERFAAFVAHATAGPIKSKEVPRKVKLEQHKLFDEASIIVRSGEGGRGEIVEEGKGRMVRNFKYKSGGQQPKMIWLPAAEPAPGADGGNVVIYVDPALDNLLHLHERSKHTAPNGAPGNPLLGSSGPQRQSANAQPRTEPLRIPVPPGTVVKRKKGGTLLGELCQPGQQVIVARGGRGGIGVKRPGQGRQADASRRRSRPKSSIVEEYELEDENYKADAQGLPGEEFALQLLLRVVADVGIVGLPNAGKSSLLAAMTRASPEIAPYPFTTLTPNLGVLQSGSQSREGMEEEEDFSNFGIPGQRQSRQSTVLADLPGLIEGAHAGRGLGRMFLRHLRRTRAILHVVDASAANPAADYWVVREELRMYNPEYCARPHVVALNKMDLEDAYELQEDIVAAVQHIAQQLKDGNEGVPSLPSAIVPVSATEGKGLTQLSEAIEPLIREDS